MPIYDITRTITPTLAVWPGDTPFATSQLLSIAKGNTVNLTTWTISAHTGTHADAPWHYAADGLHPDQLPLEKYIGAAQVVTVTRRSGGIVPDDLAHYDLKNVERLLIRTWASDLPDDQWPQDFPYPTPVLIDWLAGLGGVLLGVDMPSVDDFASTTLECHQRLRQHGIVNLESLQLRDVPDGQYQLVALPLKVAGVCASPVRAILIAP